MRRRPRDEGIDGSGGIKSSSSSSLSERVRSITPLVLYFDDVLLFGHPLLDKLSHPDSSFNTQTLALYPSAPGEHFVAFIEGAMAIHTFGFLGASIGGSLLSCWAMDSVGGAALAKRELENQSCFWTS